MVLVPRPLDDALMLLGEACFPIIEMFESCLRPIVLSSALFFAFLCWDVTGDRLPMHRSMWAPLSVFSCLVLFLACRWAYVRTQDSGKRTSEEDMKRDDASDAQHSCDNPLRLVSPMNIETKGSSDSFSIM